MGSVILHLIPAADYHALAADADVTAPSLAIDGFIHCTDDPAVLLQVANAFYRHLDGPFVALRIDVDALSSRCVWEAPAHLAGGDGAPPLAPSFPHIYGPIDRNAVVGVVGVSRSDDGSFTGYEGEPDRI